MPTTLIFEKPQKHVWPRNMIFCPYCDGHGHTRGDQNIRLSHILYNRPKLIPFLHDYIKTLNVNYVYNPNYEPSVSTVYLCCPICDGDGRIIQGDNGIENIPRWDHRETYSGLKQPSKPANLLLCEVYKMKNELYGKT